MGANVPSREFQCLANVELNPEQALAQGQLRRYLINRPNNCFVAILPLPGLLHGPRKLPGFRAVSQSDRSPMIQRGDLLVPPRALGVR